MNEQMKIGDISDSRGDKGEFLEFKREADGADFIRASWAGANVPDGWTKEIVGNHVDVIGGKAFSSDNFTKNSCEGTPLVKRKTVNNKNYPETVLQKDFDKRYLVENGELLVSMDRYFECMIWPYGDSALNQRVCRLTPSDKFNNRYLSYALQKPLTYLEHLGGTTDFTSLSIKEFDKIELPTPPINEQRKIASVIYNIDQAIEKKENIIEKIKRLKRGCVQNLLSEGYNEHDTEERRIGAKLRKIPSEWRTVEIGELAEYQNGYGFSKEQWSDTGRPIIRIQDLTTPEESDTNYFDGEIDSKYEVENGDILVSWSATLGVFRWDLGSAVLNQHIFKVRNIDSRVHEPFLYHILDDSLTQLERKLHGSTMKHVTRSAFEGTEVPLPPKEEQKQIAEVIDDIDQRIQISEAIRDQLQYLKKGIMQDLLSGKVRTTDTNIQVPDEVAQYG